MAVKSFISMAEMREARHEWYNLKQKVALVPTMGALHDGHLSLIEVARQQADIVLTSIFVNPRQFGPGEDFATYPRGIQDDLKKLSETGVDAAFLPNAGDMYPDGFQTTVENHGMAAGLCGSSRPGHFAGVLTVVMKLFNITQPHVAVFGKKDYQQFRLIARMVEDLNLPVDVVGAETVRESDGLAKSSRNAFLDTQQRRESVAVSKGLFAVRDAFARGERGTEALQATFHNVWRTQPVAQGLEYFEIRRQADLSAFAEQVDAPAVALVAARVGKTRLIDNIELNDVRTT